jgi:hypothetical protein
MSSLTQILNQGSDRPPSPECECIPQIKAAVVVVQDILVKLQNIVRQIQVVSHRNIGG